MLGLGLVGNLLAEGILQLNGLSLFALSDSVDMSATQRFWLRIGLIINHATMFLCASLVFGWIYYKNRFYQYMKTDTPVHIAEVALWSLVILCSYPLVAYLTQLNMAIPLPSWASSGQDSAFALLGNVLRMESLLELLVSLLLVGIMPALGEEFIFRGIVQNKLISIISNPHLAILIASILFGLTHMQLERLIPLSFLGMLLGYAYHYSGSIIIPVILHFLNNGLQVVSIYSLDNFDPSIIENAPDLPMATIGVSLILTVGLFLYTSQLEFNKEY